MSAAFETGSCGGRTSRNGNGAPSAKTIPNRERAGRIFRTTTRAAVPIAGVKTVCLASPIANAASVSLSRCGTATTRFSKSDSSVSPTTRAITVRTSKSSTTISTPHQRPPISRRSTNIPLLRTRTRSCSMRTDAVDVARPSSRSTRLAFSTRAMRTCSSSTPRRTPTTS